MSKIYSIGPRRAFTPLPTGEYVMTLDSWQEREEEQDSQYSKKGDIKIEWTWIVSLPNDEDTTRKTRGAIPKQWNEKSTFVHVAEALGLVDHAFAVTNGTKVNWDMGVGKKCLGTIVKKPKESNPSEMTDTIEAYALYVTASTVVQPPASNALALQDRYQQLLNFAGMENQLPLGAKQIEIANAMRALGAQPITAVALEMLSDNIALLLALDGTDHSKQDLSKLTMKDAMILNDGVSAEIMARSKAL